MKDSCQQCGTALGWQDEALICSYEYLVPGLRDGE